MKSTQYIQLRVKSWIAMTIPWQSIYICFLIVFTKKTIIGFLFVFFAGFYTFQVSKTWRIRNYIVLDFVCPNHESGGYIDLPWSIRLEEVGFFGAGHPPVLFASLLYSVKVDLAFTVKFLHLSLTSFNVIGASHKALALVVISDHILAFPTLGSSLECFSVNTSLFLLLFEVLTPLTRRNYPFSTLAAFWDLFHPPFCLQTTVRQDALLNCILRNHLLIKWLQDNHVIS